MGSIRDENPRGGVLLASDLRVGMINIVKGYVEGLDKVYYVLLGCYLISFPISKEIETSFLLLLRVAV